MEFRGELYIWMKVLRFNVIVNRWFMQITQKFANSNAACMYMNVQCRCANFPKMMYIVHIFQRWCTLCIFSFYSISVTLFTYSHYQYLNSNMQKISALFTNLPLNGRFSRIHQGPMFLFEEKLYNISKCLYHKYPILNNTRKVSCTCVYQ